MTIFSIYPPCVVKTLRSVSTKLAKARAKATALMLSHAAEICCSRSTVVCGFWLYTWSFKYIHNEKFVRSKIRRKRWPIHAASRMLRIIQGNYTIIVEEIEDFSCSMRGGGCTVLHSSRHFVQPQNHAECPGKLCSNSLVTKK